MLVQFYPDAWLVPSTRSSRRAFYPQISEATSGPYVMQQFFKGYWTPKTVRTSTRNDI